MKTKWRNRWFSGDVALASAVAGLALSAGSAMAAQPLVSAEWAVAHIGKPDVAFIDARPLVAYLRGHIPGAVHTHFATDGWRVSRGGAPGMFTRHPEKLAKLIGDFGIDNKTHVILVSPGMSSTDMGMATRMFWTFEVLGDKNVSILDGGMAAYLAAVKAKGNPADLLQKGMVKPAAKTFTMSLQKDLLANRAAVEAALKQPGVTLIDNRPSDQYLGVTRPPVDTKSGTIPGAHNVPQEWLTQNGGGMFRSKAEIEKLYAAAGVPTTGKQITFCNTGWWASIGWFVSSQILGNKDAKMYAGSMSDWTHHNMPVETKISVK